MTSLLDRKVNKLSPSDPTWVTFVRDNISSLQEQSITHIFTVADIDIYQNRLSTFFINHGVAPGSIWIAHLINKTDLMITPRDGTLLFIPEPSTLRDLYRSYRTNK